MPLSPGDMLNENLRLERELGSGGMGTVWVAHNQALGAQVAVKVLRTAHADPQVHGRFAQEARGLAQLDSPHVVRVFDFGSTAEGEPYIVMELLRGEDLAARLERGPLGVEETVHLVEQVCRALSSAHKRGIIHRDVKPANVFLTDVEGTTFVKVLDFGVAKFADAANMGMTSTGALVGTPYFMSPEQFFDPKSIDQRSDLWSIAVVVYACLTANVPFHGDTIGALTIAVHEGSFVPLTTLRPGLPPSFDAWMARALSRDPAQRHGSAMELASSLAQAAAGAHVVVPPTGDPQGATALGNANTVLPTPSATAAHTPMATPTPMHAPVAAHMPMHAPMPMHAAMAAPTPAQAGSGGGRIVLIALAALLLLAGGALGAWLFLVGQDSGAQHSDKREAKRSDARESRSKDRDPSDDSRNPYETGDDNTAASTTAGAAAAPKAATPSGGRAGSSPSISQVTGAINGCWKSNEGGSPGTAATSYAAKYGKAKNGHVSYVGSGEAIKHRNFHNCAKGALNAFAAQMPAGKIDSVAVNLPAGPKGGSAGAMVWAGTTCSRSDSGSCAPCCTGKRVVMASDCRCMKPECGPNESPIPNDCVRR